MIFYTPLKILKHIPHYPTISSRDLVSPSDIRNKIGERRVRYRFSVRSRKDLNSVELEVVRDSKKPTIIIIVNEEVQINEEDCPTVLTFKHFTKITDIHTSGPVDRNHKNVRQIKCSMEVYVPIVVSDLSSSSATSTSPGSLSQNVVIPTLRPATTRSESMTSQVWGDPSSEPTESEKLDQKCGQRDRTGRPVT